MTIRLTQINANVSAPAYFNDNPAKEAVNFWRRTFAARRFAFFV